MKKILLVVLVSLGLQTQAQQSTPYFCCDSISYWTDQGQGLSVGLDTCSRCDSLVFDQNTYTWVLFNMGNPVGLPGFVIEEDGVRWWNDVIYDMQGRELKEIPVGVMYIKGGKINLRRK